MKDVNLKVTKKDVVKQKCGEEKDQSITAIVQISKWGFCEKVING